MWCVESAGVEYARWRDVLLVNSWLFLRGGGGEVQNTLFWFHFYIRDICPKYFKPKICTSRRKNN